MTHPEQPTPDPTQALLHAAAAVNQATDNMRQAGDALRTTASHVAELNQMIQEHQ